MILLILRLALAAVFLYAGIVKAGASEGFVLALLPFTFIPPAWAEPFAILLAWTEITAGLLLLLPRVHPAGAILTILLCLVFISALTWALGNGIIVDCGCFGQDDAPSAGKMLAAIARDIVLLTAAAALIFGRLNRKPQPPV